MKERSPLMECELCDTELGCLVTALSGELGSVPGTPQIHNKYFFK